MRLELIDEFRLTDAQRRQIGALLAISFPTVPFSERRAYTKQAPHRRLLAWEDEVLVAQMGIEHRIITLADGPASVFGVVDLCVGTAFRSRGIGSRLLAHVEALGREHGIDFIVLFAHDDRLYRAHSFRHPCNLVRWVRIHEHEIIGIAQAPLPELMVKQLGGREWPNGPVDLLGHVF